jgi:hypothetical protein
MDGRGVTPHVSIMTKPIDPLPKSESVPPAGKPPAPAEKPAEHGGPKGPEPTRYGDWERNGRCSDF